MEVFGEIVEIGETAGKKFQWKAGDKVCALLGGGGYVRYVNVKYDMLMPETKTAPWRKRPACVRIPMAKAFGIRVLIPVRSDKKAKAIEHLGADRVINTRKISLHEALKEEMEKGCGVDGIDCAGGEEMGNAFLTSIAGRAGS